MTTDGGSQVQTTDITKTRPQCLQKKFLRAVQWRRKQSRNVASIYRMFEIVASVGFALLNTLTSAPDSTKDFPANQPPAQEAKPKSCSSSTNFPKS